jgi:hypothetical protein
MSHSEPFFMVYGLDRDMPSVIHDSFEQASAEARRLAEANPGVRYYVLATVGSAEKVLVHFRNIDPFEAPF